MVFKQSIEVILTLVVASIFNSAFMVFYQSIGRGIVLESNFIRLSKQDIEVTLRVYGILTGHSTKLNTAFVVFK